MDVLDEYPIAGLGVVVAVAALVYVILAAVFGGTVSPLNTVIFALVFAGVYAGFNWYLERQAAADQN